MKSFNQSLSFDNGKVVVFSRGNKTITAPNRNYFDINIWNTIINKDTIAVGCQRFSINEAKNLAKQLSLPLSKKLYTNGGRTYCNANIVDEDSFNYISSTGKSFPKSRYMVKQIYNISSSRIRIINNIVHVSSYSTDMTPDVFSTTVKAIVDCHKYLFSN